MCKVGSCILSLRLVMKLRFSVFLLPLKIIHRASQRHKIDRISILLTRYIFSGQTEGMWTQVVMMSIGDDMAPTSHGIVEFYLSWGLCLCGGNHREGRNEF